MGTRPSSWLFRISDKDDVKMRYIYVYNENSRASEYGIGTYISQIICMLKDLSDTKLIIVESRSECEEFEVLQEDGYCKYTIPCANVFRNSFENNYYRNIGYLILSVLPDSSCNEILFLFNYVQEYYILKVVKDKIPSVKSLFTIHYQDWCFHLNGDESELRKIIHAEFDDDSPLHKKVKESFRIEKLMYQLCNYTICLSKYTKNLIAQEYDIPKEKLKYIPNTITINYNPNYTQETLRNSLSLSENDIVVLFIGRLDEIKRLDVVIQAFKIFNKKYIHNSHLIIIGEGDFSTYLQDSKWYWNKITFTGKLSKEELYQFYEITDLGILPSLHEQCSYAVLEMLSFGIPVLGSNSTGLKEMIEDENMIIEYRYKDGKAYCDLEKVALQMYQVIISGKKAMLPKCYNFNYIRIKLQNLILNCGTEKHLE